MALAAAARSSTQGATELSSGRRTIALNAVITPWVAILAIGALRTRDYDPTDLQAFAQSRRGGRYWFTGGWNVPVVVAWTVGALFGVLTVNTELYVGPLAEIAGGVDLSTIGSAALAGLIYVASVRFIKA
jgi:purine-cytosine permease-like protein